ncbi:hypothetical protein [Catellatospora vulcania]|uniref:hypothetical protein n=1 Tax=Catellatospora vulcania TaxID=1460450 RepID=UPI0012D4700A|nr:hypothetical protein [Catellatospora vulcania]
MAARMTTATTAATPVPISAAVLVALLLGTPDIVVLLDLVTGFVAVHVDLPKSATP